MKEDLKLRETDFKSLSGKRVILRADFNVPIKNKKIESDFRIRRTLDTLRSLIENKAKIIIISHIENKEGATLEPVAKHLFPMFPRLKFLDLRNEETGSAINSMNDGEIIFLENIRFFKEEKENDEIFSKRLASLGDYYINEAFSVSHRNHSSIVGIPKYLPSSFGINFVEEVKYLNLILNPNKPLLFILGGAKPETKIPLLEKFVEKSDMVFVGGAIANDFFKAKGYFIGESSCSDVPKEEMVKLLSKHKLMIPIDVYTQHKGIKYLKSPDQISVGERIWDIGDKSVKMLKGIINDAHTIVWNGPMGNCEMGYTYGTEMLAKIISSSYAKTVVGGGDVIAQIQKMNIESKFSFVSTGGGAMLDFLSNETLPGIEVIMSKPEENKKVDSNKKGWFSKIFN